jgi:hypothetical protein
MSSRPSLMSDLQRTKCGFPLRSAVAVAVSSKLTSPLAANFPRKVERDVAAPAAGEIALLAPVPDVDRARAHFDRALLAARAQRAKSWELGAATSLATLSHDQSRHDEAHELLAPVYGWFSEGFQTRDLKRPELCFLKSAGCWSGCGPSSLSTTVASTSALRCNSGHVRRKSSQR